VEIKVGTNNHQSDSFLSGYTAGAMACHHNPNAIQQQIQAQHSME
jgi:hypothetical protein